MTRTIVWALCLLVTAIGTCGATPVEWSVDQGGNGHWYEAVLVSEGITWADSKVAAEQAGGYLATIANDAENNFVFSLIMDRPEFWQQVGPWVNGPWLGGYQDRNDPSYSEPIGGWKWVTGETWSYTNWMSGEPSGTDQDYLHFCGYGEISQTWDDAGASYVFQPYRGYIVEVGPVPEPASIIALLCGLGGIGWAMKRRQ